MDSDVSILCDSYKNGWNLLLINMRKLLQIFILYANHLNIFVIHKENVMIISI